MPDLASSEEWRPRQWADCRATQSLANPLRNEARLSKRSGRASLQKARVEIVGFGFASFVKKSFAEHEVLQSDSGLEFQNPAKSLFVSVAGIKRRWANIFGRFRRSDLIFALPTETEPEVFKSASGFSRTSETIRKSCALLTSTRRRQEGLCVRVDGRERRG